MAGWNAEVRHFLEAHRVGHLSTAGADGVPHVIPVCYAADAEAVYFVADEKPKRRPARELRRLRNLRENPRAALVVDDYDDDWTRLAYVLVRGPIDRPVYLVTRITAIKDYEAVGTFREIDRRNGFVFWRRDP